MFAASYGLATASSYFYAGGVERKDSIRESGD